MFKTNYLFLFLLLVCACKPSAPRKDIYHPSEGVFEIYDDEFAKTLDSSHPIEVLAEGFDWSEGPVWVEQGDYLLFNDIPQNTTYKWSEKDSLSVYLKPSGYTGQAGRGGEVGANGLMLYSDGRLMLCQHGDRRVAIMDAPLDTPVPVFSTIADKYEGKKLNSPNDLAVHSSGDIYFTDPPYGLEKHMADPLKELDFQGVYRWSVADSSVTLLSKALTRPNGILFSQDENKAYVANSDPEKAYWMVFDVEADGSFTNERIFYDATKATDYPGLPDGMALDQQGNVYATGPGGVWVFSPRGKVLGRIFTGQKTANCTFSGDYNYLYMTAHSYLLRIKLK